MKLVKAWSGKWHIFEAALPPQPAIPKKVLTCDGTTMRWPRERSIMPKPQQTRQCGLLEPKATAWGSEPRCYVCEAGGSVVLHPLPQPERPAALTVCGEEVLVRHELEGSTTELVDKLWSLDERRSKLCSKCPIERRLAFPKRRV